MPPSVNEDEDEMLRMATVMSLEQEKDPRVQENTMNQVGFDILHIGFKSNDLSEEPIQEAEMSAPVRS